jgi:hypothetical protein
MITDDNKGVFIQAYLAGKLDEPTQALVRQKIEEDPAFRTDVLMQKALNHHLDEKQQAEDKDLIAQFMVSQTNLDNPSKFKIFLRQPWLRAVAVLILVIGLGWLAFINTQKPKIMVVTMAYYQRGFGMAGDSSSKQTTFMVKFSSRGPAGGEYISSDDSLHIYLPELPADAKQWSLSDNWKEQGYILKTAQGQTYQLDKETFGLRKPLVVVK